MFPNQYLALMMKTNRRPVTRWMMSLGCTFATSLLLTACVTRKTVTEQVFIHDTIQTFHADTILMATHNARTDTVGEKVVQVITLRQDSTHTDTVRVETIRERWHTVFVTDTTSIFQHLNDSLRSTENHQTVKTEKTVRKNTTTKWLRLAFLLAVVIVVMKMVRGVK